MYVYIYIYIYMCVCVCVCVCVCTHVYKVKRINNVRKQPLYDHFDTSMILCIFALFFLFIVIACKRAIIILFKYLFVCQYMIG